MVIKLYVPRQRQDLAKGDPRRWEDTVFEDDLHGSEGKRYVHVMERADETLQVLQDSCGAVQLTLPVRWLWRPKQTLSGSHFVQAQLCTDKL